MPETARQAVICLNTALLLALALSSQGAVGSPHTSLAPGAQRSGELLLFDSPGRRYFLEGLVPGRSYEVRLSHPATIPAVIHFSIVGAGGQLTPHTRRLLDCEKHVFSVGPDGRVQGFSHPEVLVTARRRGVHRNGDGHGANTLIYNIVLQELRLGIPLDTLPVIGTALLLLLVAVAAAPYWSHRVVPTLISALLPAQAVPAAVPTDKCSCWWLDKLLWPYQAGWALAVMDAQNCHLAAGLVSRSYIAQGQQALARRQRLIKSLLSSRRLPDCGWDDATIEMFIQDCALMDSNNFLDNVGVGEREARVACNLVARRHYGLAHGIGRSGDVAAEQPKAAGSSLLAKLASLLAADALRQAGLQDLGSVTVLPLATGMALTLTMMALRQTRPPAARYVVWSRVDQKTCLKAITAACLEPVVVQLCLVGDELRTDVQEVEAAVQRLGADSVVCVVTTTSCFAPRAPDDVVAVAKVCERLGVGHVINNAYGVQSAALCAQVTSAWRKGRVDAVVQSTDKNFMVPVGGSLVAAGARRPGLVQAVNRAYPGRAAVTTHLDLLMTLLHWGAAGWREVLREREELYPHLRQRLHDMAGSLHRLALPPAPEMGSVPASSHSGGSITAHGGCGVRVLHTPGNPISLALAIDLDIFEPDFGQVADIASLPSKAGSAGAAGTSPSTMLLGGAAAYEAAEGLPVVGGEGGPGRSTLEATAGASGRDAATAPTVAVGQAAPGGRGQPGVTFLGAMLWSRCISGTRVIPRGAVTQTVAGIDFRGYGAHYDAYPHTYLTAAAAVGTTRTEVDQFVTRLEAGLLEYHRKMSRKA